ncbi:MAG: glycosyltransferase [cyanobacterium endosymbiont of Rhopalodia musculus]|uniref:glycosyltransferase n=1 Tax=cyanobacterium endosymbiont of Epithemia clementina EcSB TaxID=3034674 RepID=UPI0024806218|nr:glycosyltransferase [cyanobacterium endosymbiont of Epithemia clementina EcSB]WGT68148.1 glycosyltransferase [cyanobacterium endosymbiont of Epithemia clementina EcSB]
MICPPLFKPKCSNPEQLGTVSVVFSTLKEVHSINSCLQGLSQQSYEVREILVIDSHFQDGTQDRVKQTAQSDLQFRLITNELLHSQ